VLIGIGLAKILADAIAPLTKRVCHDCLGLCVGEWLTQVARFLDSSWATLGCVGSPEAFLVTIGVD
jgi:hypothetical protein